MILATSWELWGGAVGHVSIPDSQVIRYQGVRMLREYEMVASTDNLHVVTFSVQ